MKPTPSFKKITIDIICYLYILLFVYAAVSKLMDFENFRVQLGQSPLIGAFAELLLWIVPLSELLICALLIMPRYRNIGLYCSFALMVLFTTYIFLILNYSSIVPCSCGGILEKMGWGEHLIFNILFSLLAALAIILIHYQQPIRNNGKKLVFRLVAITLLCVAFMFSLYIASEQIIHYDNKFNRRFTHFPAIKAKDTDLKRETYYISGISNDKIYLAGGQTQLHVLEIDSSLIANENHYIDLDRKDLPFRSLNVRVQGTHFYVTDGTVPCVFKGSTTNWKAKYLQTDGAFFTLAQPLDTTAFIIRGLKKGRIESELGKINLSAGGTTIMNPLLLQKQNDGLFDTDGYMVYSALTNHIVYLYAYRNEYLIIDENLELLYKGNTIDTISKAKIDVVDIKTHGKRKLGGIPLIVNKDCAVYDNLLFVNSGIPGRYEATSMWRQASIIDVYNLNDKSYRMSFYIYDENGKKLRDFLVQGSSFYGLIGTKIVRYQLDSTITKYYQHKNLLAK